MVTAVEGSETMQPNIMESPIDREARERVRYTCFIVPQFGEACKMDKREAYLYLKKYGGLDYIRKHWWALHTDNSYYAVLDVFDICKKNGGYLV